jgi:predicted RNA-binding protein
MNEKYYLALFNEDTWNEFVEKGSSVYGTTIKRESRMASTKPGDFLICYVTKLSRFVGLLEIKSKAYLDESHIWKNDVYPVRVDVKSIYILEAKNGISVHEMKDKLEITSNIKNPKSWMIAFRTSLRVINEHDAKQVVDKMIKTVLF